MDPWENNYLLSVHIDPRTLEKDDVTNETLVSSGVSSVLNFPRTEVGLAWIDLSSGVFQTQSTDIASLPSAVARIKPREIVLDSIFQEHGHTCIVSTLREDGYIITFQEPPKEQPTMKDWIPMLEEVVNDFDLVNFTSNEIAAGGSILHYVKHQLLGSQTRLQIPVRHQAQDHMSIDKNSLRALEIRNTIRDGHYEGSLLHSLKNTVTKSGTRLLNQRLGKFLTFCSHVGLSDANSRTVYVTFHYQRQIRSCRRDD
jgi:DNA mismatch repair ATPase MutS